MSNLPLIVFLICFVLMFVLRMPIPTGMIAACTMYFLVDGLVKGNSFVGMVTGAEGQLHLVIQLGQVCQPEPIFQLGHRGSFPCRRCAAADAFYLRPAGPLHFFFFLR